MARLGDVLAWEAVVTKDGKKTIAMPMDGVIGVEALYYSKHPERYALVLTPRMGDLSRINRNLAKYQPMRLWSLEDLRAAARDTALIEPSDEMLKAMVTAGFRIKQLALRNPQVVYLE